MKRTYCTLLSLLLAAALMLAGCGDKGKGSETQPPKETDVTTTETQQSTDPKEEDIEVEPASLGTVEGNVYTNSYAGFGCKVDEGWTMLSAEDLQPITEELDQIFKDTDLSEVAASTPQIMDMQAANEDGTVSINVMYTQLALREMTAYRLMSEEKIVDALLLNKDLLIQTYEQNGMKVKSMEKGTATFLGEEHTVCNTVANVQGIDVYLTQVLCFKLPGKFGVTVTFNGLSEADVASAMEAFYKV